MSITSVKVRLARIIDNLNKDRQRNALIYSNELITLVNDRLENKGEGSEGQKFPGYSENNLSYQKALNVIKKSNRPSAAKNLKKGETSYKDIRKVLGLPVDRRTHVFKGEMLKSIEPYVIDNTETSTTIEIRPKDRENQLKLNQNSFNMKTNLLSPNQKEIEFLELANRERIKSAIND